MTYQLYTGSVRHRRFHEKAHQFNYAIQLFYFDVASVAAEFAKQRFVSVEKFNWYSFQRRHYLPETSGNLDEAARQLVHDRLGFVPTGRIFLLTQLSCLGYCFNPISLYFVLDESGSKLEALIMEVTNTPWDERHCYVLKPDTQPKPNIYTFHMKKSLHVSPFFDMQYQYHVNVKFDAAQIIVHMESFKGDKKHFDATLSVNRINDDGKSLSNKLLRHPLTAYKVVAGIYWQAFLLWCKRVTFHDHP